MVAVRRPSGEYAVLFVLLVFEYFCYTGVITSEGSECSVSTGRQWTDWSVESSPLQTEYSTHFLHVVIVILLVYLFAF